MNERRAGQVTFTREQDAAIRRRTDSIALEVLEMLLEHAELVGGHEYDHAMAYRIPELIAAQRARGVKTPREQPIPL